MEQHQSRWSPVKVSKLLICLPCLRYETSNQFPLREGAIGLWEERRRLSGRGVLWSDYSILRVSWISWNVGYVPFFDYFTCWSSGTRVPAFLHSPLLPNPGSSFPGLMHIVSKNDFWQARLSVVPVCRETETETKMIISKMHSTCRHFWRLIGCYVISIPHICHESHENSCVNFFWPV